MSTPIEVTETKSVKIVSERPENWRTLVLVGSIMGVAITFTAFALVGWRWGLFCFFLTLWEGWTLTNSYKEDTISEAVWILAKRPITVLIFSIGFAYPAGNGYFGPPRVVLLAFIIGLIYGHFFFTPVLETVKTKRTRA